MTARVPEGLILLSGSIRLELTDLLACAYARADDAVLLAGSLVEGVGNATSDLDLYVFTSSLRLGCEIALEKHHRVLTPEREIVRATDADRPVYLIHTALERSRVKLDVEFRRHEEAQALLVGLRKSFEYATQNLILFTKELRARDSMLLHRLFSGRRLQDGPLFSAILPDDCKRLAYVLYRTTASSFAYLLDLAGAMHAGNSEQSVDLAQRMLCKQMLGLLRLRGFTFPHRKSLLLYTARLGSEDSELAAEFNRLFFLPGTQAKPGRTRYVDEVLDLVDRIYERSAVLLEGEPLFPSGSKALALLRENMRDYDTRSEYAAVEYEYRAKVYGERGRPSRLLMRALAS